jgi:hypothetical protein
MQMYSIVKKSNWTGRELVSVPLLAGRLCVRAANKKGLPQISTTSKVEFLFDVRKKYGKLARKRFLVN